MRATTAYPDLVPPHRFVTQRGNMFVPARQNFTAVTNIRTITARNSDILLISQTVTGLQLLLQVCEEELANLDMRVNTKKSMCIRFGQRVDAKCTELLYLLVADRCHGLIAANILVCISLLDELSNVHSMLENQASTELLTQFTAKLDAMLQQIVLLP